MTAPPRSIPALKDRLNKARLKGGQSAATGRARKLLLVYLDTAQAHGVPYADIVRQLATGVAALRIAGADLQAQAGDPHGPAARAACAQGCAFCCILGGAGGTVTEAEARQLHTALAPLAGRPDGRDWHPRACPALDPTTRMCRVYDARPMICRSYLSDDAEACKKIAEGVPAAGAGVLGAQGVMLAAMALIRATLKGVAPVPSFALAQVAAGAVAGQDAEAALKAARQKPRDLDDERRRLSGL